jgi:hypothetical protein
MNNAKTPRRGHPWLAAAYIVLLLAPAGHAQPTNPAPAPLARYEIRPAHDPNGIGTFYMGREIAQVMGHQGGAEWLERAERAHEERPDLLLPALKLKPGDQVADIGAGTGYYTRRLAKFVGETGAVYAVEIQPEMLDDLTNKMAQLHKIGRAHV